MKITSVDVMELKVRANPNWRPIICRINTDEGIYGYGEAALAYGMGASAAFGMIRDLAKMIIGMDPLDNEVIWNKLYLNTFWAQNGGPVVYSGMSAIDIALWDIRGKFFNVPVYKLLGGKKRDKLRAYASQLQFGWEDKAEKVYAPAFSPEDYARAARKAVNEGYDAIKIDFFIFTPDGGQFRDDERTGMLKPYYLHMIEDRLSAVRKQIGPNVDIIIENHSLTDALSSVQIGQMAEKYNIFYFEEPTTPTPDLTRAVKTKVRIPLASGEKIYTRWQFAPYLREGLLQVIQPDLGTCGGITEAKKICDMAYVYDASVQIHVCGSPISTAAALQIEAVIPNFCIHEHHIISRSQGFRELCVNDYQPIDGSMSVPELPGIGNELSEYALKTADIVTVTETGDWR
jgi:galactonate dehydratase